VIYVSSNDSNADLVNPALTDLAERIGNLVVTNALLVAENKLLLQLVNRGDRTEGDQGPVDGQGPVEGAEAPDGLA
jgi:hypothetical protein